MKKILIAIIGFILLILIIISCLRGIRIWKASVYSINDIKAAGTELNTKIEEANVEKNQNYAKALSQIDKSTKQLKDAKEQYEAKVESLSGNTGIGITQIEKYKIEYLWNKIGNYAKQEGLKIDLDIEETSIKDSYNIKFTIQGSYVGITDFLYDIENDDELNYKVKDFAVEPTTTTTSVGSTSTTDKTTTVVDTSVLVAKFTVENVIINFD